jgi:hypothetical protein
VSWRRWLAVAHVLALVGLALAFSWSHWSAAPRWTTDGLFYEAQTLEVTGTAAGQARQEVFSGPLGRLAIDGSSHVTDRAWIDFSAPFYRRRWVVPMMAAAIRPLVGDRGLQVISLVGYVLVGVFTYLLARRRFSPNVSLVAGAVALWFPALRKWAGYPLTDTMGIAALILSLLTADWALRGSRWLLFPWACSVAVLAFTRDTAAIAVFAAAWVALSLRTRRAVALTVSGALAALPVPLLFGAPLSKTMAFTLNENEIPPSTSWHFVLSHDLPNVKAMIETEFPIQSHWALDSICLGVVLLLAFQPKSPLLAATRATTLALTAGLIAAVAALVEPLQLRSFPDPTPSGLLIVGALLPLFLPAGGDRFLLLIRGGAVGAAAYLFLLPEFTAFRLALVLLPFAALGLARAVELATQTVRVEASSEAQLRAGTATASP